MNGPGGWYGVVLASPKISICTLSFTVIPGPRDGGGLALLAQTSRAYGMRHVSLPVVVAYQVSFSDS